MADKFNLVIEFPNARARRNFAAWLCGSGEQDYWHWMECRETEEDGDITVTFNYHPIVRPDLPATDAARYGKFIADNTIRTLVKPRSAEVDHERNALLGIDPSGEDEP